MKELDLRDDAWRNVVTHKVGGPFLLLERLIHAANMPAAVFNADEKRAARSLGESHDGSARAVWRRQVTLELQCLAFGTLKYRDRTRNFTRTRRTASSFRVEFRGGRHE